MAEDEPLIEEDLEQALDDLKGNRNWAEGAVLWSTDWTAETVLSQLTRNNIDLDPSFQRRSAWTDTKQSLFIESLILGLPIPQLILADAKGKKGAFIVIDGKQRLLAIRRFCSNDPDGEFKPLKLKGLKELSRLNGKTYADLIASEEFAEDRAAFENASIRTVVIRAWQDEEYLYEVFLRINTGSVQLSPQELRQALHPGPFSKFVGDASADSIELKRALNLSEPDFRMRDAEILLRYIAYRNFIGEYSGNLKQFLDDATKNLNASWGAKEAEVNEQVAEMERALVFTREAFGEKQYLRKWNGEDFESRKNRAVFDIMLHYFSQPEIRANLSEKHAEVVGKFKALCENNAAFRSSIETTTKSVESNRARFNIWGDAVAELSEVDVSDLKFPENNVVG
ncbi:MAG: DUF262 domain-containing protein [Burkholderiaceae bacterium]|nr:DUF262 domain-containing protein [Burkholderiaceae bacterium]